MDDVKVTKRPHQRRGTPRVKEVTQLTPREEVEAARARLRGSVLKYEKPTEPVIELDKWDANK